MSWDQANTLFSRVMSLAGRPEGVRTIDITAVNRSDTARAFRALEARGLGSREIEGPSIVFRCTANQLARYLDKSKQESKDKRLVRPKVKPIPKAAGVVKATWSVNDAPHFPTDAEGRPLYKITVAAPPPQPLKTNTYSGAY